METKRQRSVETLPPDDHYSRVSSVTAFLAQASSTISVNGHMKVPAGGFYAIVIAVSSSQEGAQGTSGVAVIAEVFNR